MSCSEWREVKLGDLCDIVMGQSPKGENCNNAGNGTPLLNGPTEFGLFYPQAIQYTTDVKKQCRVGDLLFCVRGSTTGRMNWANEKYAIGRGLAAIRHKNGFDYNPFIRGLLDYKLDEILKSATGSTFPNVSKDLLNLLQVNVPPLPNQKAIADTLSCLDDKIELNNRINKTLEEMAQAIFKSWFVDFEPFQDGEFEDSELGPIPKGWTVGTISDLGDVVGGSTPSKSRAEYYTDKGIPWITPKDLSTNKDKFISRGAFDITDLGLKNSSTKIMPKGTVLFSSRAPIGYIAIAKNELTTNQGFKSIVPKSSIGTAYVYYFLKRNTEFIENNASGTTFKEVSSAVMRQIPALIPSNGVLDQLQCTCSEYFKLQMTLEDENRVLSNLRDTLLPKLMSGEIRVCTEKVW